MSLPQHIAPKEDRSAQDADAEALMGDSLGRRAWRRLWANRLARFSLITLSLLVVLFVVGPWVWPHSPIHQDFELFGGAGPSLEHPFGVDVNGRDLLARVLSGGRLSLAVGLLGTAVSLLIGVAWGGIAGYFGGRLDATLMRIVDILYSLPFTVFVILLMTVVPRDTWVDDSRLFQMLGLNTNLLLMFLAIGAVEWLTMARIVRGQVMAIRRQEFVEAAVALGLPARTILLRHIAPNVLGPVVVYSTLTVPAVMLLESFISFLGLGVQPPQASWGLLIKEGAENMTVHPWMLLIPSFFFSLTLFCLNFLGDGLRDALDPRSG